MDNTGFRAKGERILIVVKISDGLGNQMFQYAYARALQEQISQKVYIDPSDINNIIWADEVRKEQWIKLCDKREYQLQHFSITLPVIDKENLNKKFKKAANASKFIKYCSIYL